MKQKHNKKRNTAFIYESLIKEITKSIIQKNDKNKIRTLKILKKYFSPNSVLKKELEIYQSLYENCSLDKDACEKILREAKFQHRFLNPEAVFNQQTKLINEINKQLSSEVYNNFIPNYKTLASISQIFSGKLNPKSSILLEKELLNYMSNNNEINESNLKPIDNLVLKSFIGKFNEKYSDDLLSEQKALLSHYISSFSDNGLQLKMFLNEELGRLKSELKNSLNLKEIYSDTAMLQKVEKLIEKLNSFYEVDINESMLKQILKTQNLVKGINE
tara:strand:- start:368 stop:1189 length:822 start_codon:yes stop_codon:yes gene_type:complete